MQKTHGFSAKVNYFQGSKLHFQESFMALSIKELVDVEKELKIKMTSRFGKVKYLTKMEIIVVMKK